MVPFWGLRIPSKSFSNVVFPDPLGPIIAVTAPVSTQKLTSCTTSEDVYANATLVTSIAFYMVISTPVKSHFHYTSDLRYSYLCLPLLQLHPKVKAQDYYLLQTAATIRCSFAVRQTKPLCYLFVFPPASEQEIAELVLLRLAAQKCPQYANRNSGQSNKTRRAR